MLGSKLLRVWPYREERLWQGCIVERRKQKKKWKEPGRWLVSLFVIITCIKRWWVRAVKPTWPLNTEQCYGRTVVFLPPCLCEGSRELEHLNVIDWLLLCARECMVCGWACVYLCHSVCTEVRGQLAGVCSLLSTTRGWTWLVDSEASSVLRLSHLAGPVVEGIYSTTKIHELADFPTMLSRMWVLHLPQTSISSSRFTLHLQVNSGTPQIGKSSLDVFSSEFLVKCREREECGGRKTIVAIPCLSPLPDRSSF